MNKVVVQATVELTFPDELRADDFDADVFGVAKREVRVGLSVEMCDVVLRFSTPGEIGRLLTGPQVDEGKSTTTITIKKLLLRSMRGHMLPVYDAESGSMVFFTTEKSEVADKPLVVGGA